VNRELWAGRAGYYFYCRIQIIESPTQYRKTTYAMSKTSVFMDSRRLCSDDCAKEARDKQNEEISGYNLYTYHPVACESPKAQFPAFSYDHVNLRGRVGYGLADDCIVDRYSSLRTDPSVLTRDRCRVQLFSRIFTGCPNLKPGVADAGEELKITQGQSSTNLEGVTYSCKRAVMEKQTANFTPLIPCVAEIQKEEHIVEPWIRGGDSTRDFVRRQEFLDKCGAQFQRNSVRH